MKRVLPNLSNLTEVLSYYDDKLKGFSESLALDDKELSFAMMEQPTWFARYDQIRAELKSNHNFIDYQCEVIETRKFKELSKTMNKTHTDGALTKMAKDNPEFREMNLALLEIEERYLKANSIVESFSQRGFCLNNLTKVYIAALHDVTINGYD